MPTLLEEIARLDPEASPFKGTRILVIGDIAFDRTWRCKPRGTPHQSHECESPTLELEKRTDTVGSAYNTCLLCRELGAETSFIGVVGDDDEGKAVRDILARISQMQLSWMA